jgi:hypothetical protein
MYIAYETILNYNIKSSIYIEYSIAFLFSQCDVRRIGLWGVVAGEIYQRRELSARAAFFCGWWEYKLD